MNAVWNSYGQLCGCPEIFKKSCKFFCRELDIRVKKDVAPFFFIGYFVVAYSGMTTTGVALFAILILAVMFTMKKGVFGAGKATVVTGEKGGDFDEF